MANRAGVSPSCRRPKREKETEKQREQAVRTEEIESVREQRGAEL